MSRLTFGVKSSPYLASQVLLQVADVYNDLYPKAAEVIRRYFYVDDCLLSVDTPQEAEEVAQQLIAIFDRSCMTLRKWRSSSPELIASTPAGRRHFLSLHLSKGSRHPLEHCLRHSSRYNHSSRGYHSDQASSRLLSRQCLRHHGMVLPSYCLCEGPSPAPLGKTD